jgi:hypothetical protein
MSSDPPDDLDLKILKILKILELPYSDRQLVVVSDDVIVKAARQAELENVTKQRAVSWGKIASTAASTAASIAFGTPAVLVAEVARSALDAWTRARESGMRVLQVGKGETSQIAFPPGHPRDGVLYIGHPAKPGVYYTAAEFHRVTFEHKVSEAINLLMHLGATRIKVEHVKGWSREFAARMSVPLSASGETAGGEASSTGRGTSAVLYEARLRGTKTPRLPEDLVWYPHEPTWQSIAKGRLDFGLQDFSLSIVYEDDFGVHAGLKASALKAGFDLGGRFEDHTSTTWRIAGEFGDPSAGPHHG